MAHSLHVRTRLNRRCKRSSARRSMEHSWGGGSSSQPSVSSVHNGNPNGLQAIRIGVKKTDKKKLPMDNEFSTMEHLAKAQAGYIRTVNELREKVAELEGNKLIAFIRSKLSMMLKLITDLVGGVISGTDKRTQRS